MDRAICRLNNKKGAVFILLVMVLALLFPVIIAGVIDVSNLYRLNKDLKFSLNAATKSAATRADWELIPEGIFLFDEPASSEAICEVFNSNLGIDPEDKGDYYEASSQNGRVRNIRLYYSIYNQRHEGTFVSIPTSGVPVDVTDHDVFASADRPTVFSVASAEYRISPIFGGRIVRVTQASVAQMNVLQHE